MVDSPSTSDYVMSLIAELRKRIAHLINCNPEEVVFVQSATEGLNMVRNGLNWKTEDAIVIRGGRHEHYANHLPWLVLSQKKGVKLKELRITDENGYFDLGQLEELIKGSQLITLSHVLYNTGAIMPVEEVGKIAQKTTSYFVLMRLRVLGLFQLMSKRSDAIFWSSLALSGSAAPRRYSCVLL